MTDANIDPDGLLAAAADDTATARKLLDDAAARLGEYSETVPVSNYAQAAAAIATGYAQLANIGVQVASNAGAATQNERIFELQSAVADAHRAMEARMRAEQVEIEARTAKLAELDVATLAAAGQREERAVAEARPHDEKTPLLENDAERLAAEEHALAAEDATYPAELDIPVDNPATADGDRCGAGCDNGPEGSCWHAEEDDRG